MDIQYMMCTPSTMETGSWTIDLSRWPGRWWPVHKSIPVMRYIIILFLIDYCHRTAFILIVFFFAPFLLYFSIQILEVSLFLYWYLVHPILILKSTIKCVNFGKKKMTTLIAHTHSNRTIYASNLSLSVSCDLVG